MNILSSPLLGHKFALKLRRSSSLKWNGEKKVDRRAKISSPVYKIQHFQHFQNKIEVILFILY